ncbi:IS1/IS1595 family N-terminal zinc-binding domain-containing protein, partial [Wandonia haliotis]|uniref:IS1/IS1595 family N-terminal zinc-binding domain-containing protein n=1 Tax=Wandonia haliotis TaxID=574963 RepID=UPI003CD06C5C
QLVGKMKCRHCNSSNTIKYGYQQNGKVRHHCKSCFRYFQESYRYQSSITEDKAIIVLTKESCGIRSISRILNISSSTVIRRTKKIANGLARPYPG